MLTSTWTKRLPTSWRSWPESAKKKLRDELLFTSQEYTKRINTLLALHTALTARVAALEFDALVATDGPTTEARNGGWISVKEGLPSRGEIVEYRGQGEFHDFVSGPAVIARSEATHWRPLPDAPRP